MSRSFQVKLPLEVGYQRKALFAIEVLDGVTLSRLSDGIDVVAEGLRGKPFVNASGLFVWLHEDIDALQRISVDPGRLPYERVEIRKDDLTPLSVKTIELPPRLDYAFTGGITALRGTLLEDRMLAVPVRNARVRLRWLDDDGVTWRDASTSSSTNHDGDFVSMLRLGATEQPQVDANGAVTARLIAQRESGDERRSPDLKLPQGRVADPSTSSAFRFAWDELQS